MNVRNTKPKEPRIFLYGFGPYKEFRDNITQQLLAALPSQKNVRTHIFDVMFDREMFVNEISQYKPDIIIGLGQHPRARKIRIERKARNEKAESKRQNAKRIDRSFPTALRTTYTVSPTKESTVTYDAGTYVCNFSMFTCLTLPEELRAPYAFLHIPRTLDVHKGVRFLEKLIQAAQRQHEE